MSQNKFTLKMMKDHVPEKVTRLERILCAMLSGAGCKDFDDMIEAFRAARRLDAAFYEYENKTRPEEFKTAPGPHPHGFMPSFGEEWVCMSRQDFRALLRTAISRYDTEKGSIGSVSEHTSRLDRLMEIISNE